MIHSQSSSLAVTFLDFFQKTSRSNVALVVSSLVRGVMACRRSLSEISPRCRISDHQRDDAGAYRI